MAFNTDNIYLDAFLDLMQWLKDIEEDEDAQLDQWLNRTPSLDYKYKQIGYSEKQKIIDLFETIIDQPAFMTNDHKRFRKLLIDWYSTHRATVTHTRQSLDPHSMASEALNEMIKCFGFPYPHKIVTSNLKAQFILDIIELYKKKGTPRVLVKALQTYFGLNNVVLSEWWIHHNGINDTFYAKAHPIIPRSFRTDPRLTQELSYDVFIRNKPLWHLTEDKLRDLYDECVITLPSITTYISMNGTLNVMDINIALTILNRKIQESYEFWLATGTLNKNVYLSKLSSVCSLLSLVLAITYLFNSQYSSTDTNYLFYNGFYAPLDVIDVDGNRDDRDDVDYGFILDEYKSLTIRPTTKVQRELLLEQRYDRFTEVGSTQSVTTALGDAATYLELIQPEFKEEIDNQLLKGDTDSIISSLLEDLDFHMINNMEIIGFPISYLIIGAPIEEYLKDVIDFFKPYHTQLRDFTNILSFDDPLGDSQLEADKTDPQIIYQWHVEEGNWADEIFDQGLVKDDNIYTISHDITYCCDSTGEQIFTNIEFDEIGEVDLVTNPDGISNVFEIIIKVDGITTSYNDLPEVIIWKTL